jgi:hypothetical protein
VSGGAPAADRRFMVNAEIPLIVIAHNGLWCSQRAEARHADGLRADHSKQTIARSALVSHNVKKHRTYQFMNTSFVRVHRFMGRKVDIEYDINVLRIIRLSFFAGVLAEFEALTNR